jgi:hypothetical protein
MADKRLDTKTIENTTVILNETTLSDYSKAYEVCITDGPHLTTLECSDLNEATAVWVAITKHSINIDMEH